MNVDHQLVRETFKPVFVGGMDAQRLDTIVRILEDPENVQELSASPAVIAFGRYKYRVSLRKLCAALASVILESQKSENPALCLGLGLVAALGALDGIVQKLSVDEVGICQAFMQDSYSKTSDRDGLSISSLRKMVGHFTQDSKGLVRRVETAIARLEGLNVVEKLPDHNVVLREMILLGRRPSV